MKRLIPLAAAAAVLAAAIAAPFTGEAAGAGGVTGAEFYVDGVLYRTVGTPSDFSGTGAPDSSYDAIYVFGDLQAPVADAAPGQPGYNGGRWQVHALAFSSYAGALADDSVDMNMNDVLDSDEEVLAAIAEGYATDGGVVASFECPVIKVPAGGA